MAKRKPKKKLNYIFREPNVLFLLALIFGCTLIKMIYLNKTCQLFGVGLYSTCFIIFLLPLSAFFVTFYSVSKKAVLTRKARGQIRNALQWIQVSSFGAFIWGLISMLFLVIFKGHLGRLLNIQSLGNLIFIFLGIAIPFFLFNSVMAGGFFGLGLRMPVYFVIGLFSVSDFFFGILFSLWIGKAGNINSALFHNTYINIAFYGAGIAVGFLIGNILSAGFQILLLRAFLKSIKNGTIEQYGKNSENRYEQLRSFVVASGYPLLRNLLYVLPIILCIFFSFHYTKLLDFNNKNHLIYLMGTGFVQIFLPFLIPMYLSKLLARHSEELLKKSMAKQDRYHGSMRMLFSFKQFLCFVLPLIFFVGLCAADLADLLIKTSAPDIIWQPIALFSLMACAKVLYGFLEGFDKSRLYITNQIIGLFSETVFLFFIAKKDPTLENILLSLITFYGVVCIANILCLYRYNVYKKQLMRHIGYPLLAFFAFVVVAFLVLLLKHTLGIVISMSIAFIFAFLAQTIVLLLTGTIKEHELSEYPQSQILLFLGKMIGVY